MFDFFNLLMKRVNDQAAEYAAAQADVARRSLGDLFDPFHVLQPAKVTVDRRVGRQTPRHRPSTRRRSL